MNKMSLQKALRVIRGYVDTIEKYYPGWCSKTEGIMGACQVVVEKVPDPKMWWWKMCICPRV